MKKRFSIFAVVAALLFLATSLLAAPSYFDGNFTNVLLKGYLSGQKSCTLDNVQTSNVWTATVPAAGYFYVKTGNLKVGNGTPDATLNGEDAYIKGTLEVDSAVRFDASTLTLRGVAYTLPAADGAASQYLQTDGSGALSWAAGTSGSLDDAYNGGVAVTVDAGAIALTNNAANNTGLLSLAKSPVGAQSGDLLAITAGANASGDLIQLANSGTGKDIAGTGATWSVTKAGAGTFDSLSTTGDVSVGGVLTSTNFYQAAIAAAAAGNVNLTVDAAGNGTITVGGISTGNTIFPGAAVFNGNVDIGNAATDTLTITSIIDGSVTLDDGVTDSPSLILKDATDETATLVKTDGANLDLTTSATEGLRIMTGNLRVGNGNPGTAAMDGEDFYVNGASEFDGAVQLDGALTAAAGATISGAASTINHDSNFNVGINTGSSNGALSLGGGSGTVAVNSTTWDVSTAGAFTGVTGLTFAANAAATVTVATNGAAQDLTLSQTGATDSSIIVSTTGTGADALQLTASAGGIDIAGAAGGDIDITSTGKSVNITATEAAADQIKLSAEGAIAGNAVNIATTDGGIVLTAGGAANGDITLTAGDDLTLTVTDALAVNATGVAAITSADWGITSAGAVTKLASVGFDSSTIVYHDTIELSNADIKALNAAPKALVAAKGANTVIELVSAVIILDYGTEALTAGAGDDLVIEYATSGQDATASIESTGLVTAAADTIAVIPAATIAAVAASSVVNKGLQLYNIGAEFAGNATADATMTVKVAYRVHADGL